ncbi:thioredoxin-dependent thiol peroxidase [Ancylobacter terrae]|uniref:thioredoxin-dependent thiol peroxidase n=1 Tax=Ancylobacter sp. sgz301288 TaxID=3342077 RepID=UPI00385D9501
MSISVGDAAPDFTLTGADGGAVRLPDFAGRSLVLYFYPKADTPGCTREAMDFNRLRTAFEAAGAAVLGVSADPAKALAKFKTKHELGFALAGDETHAMLEGYGVWAEKSMYGKTYMGVTRTTFLIDPNGKVARIWPKVSVEGHAEEVLEAVRAL